MRHITFGNNALIIPEEKFWFYVRKCLFAVILPSILAFMSLIDFANSSKGSYKEAYKHIYFYTSFILCLHTILNYVLAYIFSICADDYIFKKGELDMSLHENFFESDIFLTENKNSHIDKYIMVINRKIFKPVYSGKWSFIFIDKLCWILGISSPLLIPKDLVGDIDDKADNENPYYRI
jgi:hypothetical protein